MEEAPLMVHRLLFLILVVEVVVYQPKDLQVMALQKALVVVSCTTVDLTPPVKNYSSLELVGDH